MSLSPEVVEVLVEHHRKFLDFLVPRVGTPEAAEELLQAAFVKGMESGSSLREEERAVAWLCGTCCTHGCVDCACTPGMHRPAGSTEEG